MRMEPMTVLKASRAILVSTIGRGSVFSGITENKHIVCSKTTEFLPPRKGVGSREESFIRSANATTV